jgi:hypothetical protein
MAASELRGGQKRHRRADPAAEALQWQDRTKLCAYLRGVVGNIDYQLTKLLRIGPGKVKCDASADELITFARCLD